VTASIGRVGVSLTKSLYQGAFEPTGIAGRAKI